MTFLQFKSKYFSILQQVRSFRDALDAAQMPAHFVTRSVREYRGIYNILKLCQDIPRRIFR